LLLLYISVLIWHFIASQSFLTLSTRLQVQSSSSNFPTVSHTLSGLHWLGETDSPDILLHISFASQCHQGVEELSFEIYLGFSFSFQ